MHPSAFTGVDKTAFHDTDTAAITTYSFQEKTASAAASAVCDRVKQLKYFRPFGALFRGKATYCSARLYRRAP